MDGILEASKEHILEIGIYEAKYVLKSLHQKQKECKDS